MMSKPNSGVLDLDGGAEVGVVHRLGQLAQLGPWEDHREHHDVCDDERGQPGQ